MNIFDKTYASILQKVILPLGDFVFGGNYTQHLKTWQSYDKLSETELEKIQQQKLVDTLHYVNKHVPLYRNKVEIDTNDPISSLKKLPILSKELLRKHTSELVSDEYDVSKLKKNYSSGSSGVQSFSYSDSKNVFLTQAIQRHWFLWSGYQEGYPVLQLGMAPKRTLVKKLKDVFFRTTYVDAFSLGEEDYQKVYQILKRKRIRFVIGYPSSIYELAKWMDKHHKKHSLNAIISLGDKLFPYYEELYDIVFQQPKTLDTYGCAEGFMIACRYDIPNYYITSPHVVVEVVDDYGNEVKAGELGHVLVTGLTSFAQPFLRYKLGDLAIKLPKNEYPKNRAFNYPLLKKIIGRETDLVQAKNGKNFVVYSFTGVFAYYSEIVQFKVIQNKIDELEIEYIPGDNIDLASVLEKIEAQLKEVTDGLFKFNFKEVNYIAPTKSGKPQIIESNL
ncbi:MAG: hypothetical protein ACQESK_01225 [Bacteroidota bacterium]